MLGQKLGHNNLGLIGGQDLNHLRVHPAKVHQRNGRRGRVRPVSSIGRIVPSYDLYLGGASATPTDKESVVDEEEDEEEEEKECPRGREGRPREEEG